MVGRYFVENMADRARRAEARAQRRQEAAEAVEAGQDNVNEEDSDDNEEMEDVPVRVPHRRARGPAVAPQLALDPGMWKNGECEASSSPGFGNRKYEKIHSGV